VSDGVALLLPSPWAGGAACCGSTYGDGWGGAQFRGEGWSAALPGENGNGANGKGVTGNRALAGKRRGGGVMWWYGAGRRDAMAVGELGHERARCPEVEQAKQVTGSLQSCTTWRRERHLKHRRCLGNEKERETPLMRGGAWAVARQRDSAAFDSDRKGAAWWGKEES
jgi:hypothetical protein